MKSLAHLAGILFVSALSLFAAPASPASTPVRVILWFDTEDYLLPADDDAAKRLAEMLTARHIRATFKVVGEKARVLEQRRRRDVISALAKHDIGYHANFHSVHPTPTEYLAECGWLDGVAEFARREGGGAADVRRIFGVKTLACYGQPGSSWAPQALGALAQIGVAPHGVPCYVDEGTHVGLNEKPFWYAGALTVYRMGQNRTRMDLHDPAAVEPAKQKVSAIAERLRGEGGGLISIYYHPCEWVHQEFWDGVNFRRGANPPREDWKAPAQRPAAETESAFQRFAEYIDHIRAIPAVQFITASDLPLLYPDPAATAGASEADLLQLAARLTDSAAGGLDFQLIQRTSYSVSDQFELLTGAVADQIEGRKTRYPVRATRLIGPDNPPPTNSLPKISWPAFRDATLDVRQFIQREHRIPARIHVGAEAVPPADFLIGLAAAFRQFQTTGKFPAEVILEKNVELLPARQVAKDTPGLFGGWIIHPENFRAPRVVEQARLQAWTLKPAMAASVK